MYLVCAARYDSIATEVGIGIVDLEVCRERHG
jgi:hypothetical protein